MPDPLSVHPAPLGDAAAQALLREYLAEVVGRYHGRPLADVELDNAVVEFASEDLIMPPGLLLVARVRGHAAGCAGLRVQPDAVGEIVRVFVREPYRRRGVARALMTGVEMRARDLGLHRLRLDTRHDLIESRALYAAIGYLEAEPFNAEPYAEHWFEKTFNQPIA